VLAANALFGGICANLMAQETLPNLPQGVVFVLSYSGQSPEFAKALLYSNTQNFAAVIHVYNGGSNPTIVQKNMVDGMLPLTGLFTGDLVGESGTKHLQRLKASLGQAQAKYQSASEILLALVSKVDECLANLVGNQVRFRGEWMATDAYDRIVEVEKKVAQDSARRRLDEIADTKLRKENLEKRAQTLGGAEILTNFKIITAALSTGGTGSRGDFVVPQNLFGQTLLLPKLGMTEYAMREGSASGDPAVLISLKEGKCTNIYACAVVRDDDDGLFDSEELTKLRSVIASSNPELGGWLPFALTTARTLTKFQVTRTGRASKPVKISREVPSGKCELTFTAPKSQADGTVRSIVVILIN